MANAVGHFEIPSDDPEKLSEFYTRLFDWQVQKFSGEGFDYWLVLTVPTNEQGMPTEPGGINGGIFKRMAPEQKPINYVIVDSVDAYVAKAGELGATVAMGKMPIPNMGYFAQLVDPDGNMFGVFQADEKAG
jgi:predicted enzyme related to lactoylglutathione lyase